MMSSLPTMLTCHWSSRRLQRYLDADLSAPLDPGAVRRLVAHLERCARCTAAVEEYRGVSRALMHWSRHRGPDPAATARMRHVAQALLTQDSR